MSFLTKSKHRYHKGVEMVQCQKDGFHISITRWMNNGFYTPLPSVINIFLSKVTRSFHHFIQRSVCSPLFTWCFWNFLFKKKETFFSVEMTSVELNSTDFSPDSLPFFFPSPFLSGSSSFPHLKMLESLRVLVYKFFYFPNSLPRTCHPANKIYRHIFPIFPFLLSPASLVNHGILYQFVFLESPLRCQLVHCTC